VIKLNNISTIKSWNKLFKQTVMATTLKETAGNIDGYLNFFLFIVQ